MLHSLHSAAPCTHPGGVAGLIKAAFAETEALADEVVKLEAYRVSLRRRREREARYPELFPPAPAPVMDMEQTAALIAEAEGYAMLRMNVDAFAVLEEQLPPEARDSPAATAVKLIVFTALRLWEEGLPLCDRITPDGPPEQRAAAGRFLLGCAIDRAVFAPDEARALITRLAVTWPEGRLEAMEEPAIAALF